MPLVQIKIENQLLIPFGGPKWSIERINVVGVSTTGTYIESDTPLGYINKAESKALWCAPGCFGHGFGENP